MLWGFGYKFHDCSSNVTNIINIISGFKLIESRLDISKLNISIFTNIDLLFFECSALILPVISKENLFNNSLLENLFFEFLELEYLPNISK